MELVVARARGREQDDVARARLRGGAAERTLELARLLVCDARARERRSEVARRLPDEVHRAGAAAELARELVVALPLAAAAEDHVQRRVERGQRAQRGGRVRRL